MTSFPLRAVRPDIAIPTSWTTTILVKNMHCASCAAHVEELLEPFRVAIKHVDIIILTHEIRIHHDEFLSIEDLCLVLDNAAFEVYNATTEDVAGHQIRELVCMDDDDGWFESVTGRRRPGVRASSSSTEYPLPNKKTAKDHVAKCKACRTQSNQPRSPISLASEKYIDLEQEKFRSDEKAGAYVKAVAVFPSCESDRTSSLTEIQRPKEVLHVGTLSIGGMTCASCTSAIDHTLAEISFVKSISVSLMTNSAKIIFSGRENLQNIVDAVEDLGYECAVDQVDQDSSLDRAERKEIRNPSGQRIALLKVTGIFCGHCPLRIQEAITSKHSSAVTINKFPDLQDPIMEIAYTPKPPGFTIREIVETIDSVSENFSTTFYTQPSIEQRSQVMQRHEQSRLFVRLCLTFVVAIPTFLIGVIWMSLVPATNTERLFFEDSTWAGNVSRSDWALFILATPVYFFAADIFHVRSIKEIRSLWRRSSRVPIARRLYRFGSMNLLISAGTSVAYFSSIILLGINAANPQISGTNSTYFDSVIFLTFFILIGRWLEVYSKAKTGNAVAMLGKLRPQEAILAKPVHTLPNQPMTLEKSEETALEASSWITEKIDANLLEIGDVVFVSHGSSPPADGLVIKGSTQFNESSLTGEGRPVIKNLGDAVFAGAVNVGDAIHVKVTDVNGTSMLDQIVAVVREGQTKSAPVERVVDTVTGYFVPAIALLAICTWIIWLALGFSGALSKDYLGSSSGGWAFWSLEFAIAVFVVACPCGIGLAAPTALFVGSGLAARNGILVRGGGEAFQEASNIDAVVFDKTGTLTESGDVKVTDHEMFVEGEEASNAWAIIQTLEGQSSHPLAHAILQFASTKATDLQVGIVSSKEEPGRGMTGQFTTPTAAYQAALGSENLVASLEPAFASPTYFASSILSKWKSQSKSVAILALRRMPTTSSSTPEPWAVTAMFATSDQIRQSAVPTLSALESRGIPAYMLTGDNLTTASAVASTLSIPQDRVFAGILPTEKAAKIRWLQENGPRRKGNERRNEAIVAFVGDGINDAPALTQANISISLSSASDIAVNSSSFVLLPPTSLLNIVTLLDLSQRVFRRVKINFLWAIVYNAVLVPVAAGVLFRVKEEGWRLGPVWGSAAMALSSLGVIMSSLLLRWEDGFGGLDSWNQAPTREVTSNVES